MARSQKQIITDLSPDESEVVRKIRDTKYGTVEADIRNGRIIQIGSHATFKPPSLLDDSKD